MTVFSNIVACYSCGYEVLLAGLVLFVSILCALVDRYFARVYLPLGVWGFLAFWGLALTMLSRWDAAQFDAIKHDVARSYIGIETWVLAGVGIPVMAVVYGLGRWTMGKANNGQRAAE